MATQEQADRFGRPVPPLVAHPRITPPACSERFRDIPRSRNPSVAPNSRCSRMNVGYPTMLAMSRIGSPPPNNAAAIGNPIQELIAKTIRPQAIAAPNRAAPCHRKKRATTAKTAPYIAPTIMWIIAPSTAGPNTNVNEFPAIAASIDLIIVSGAANVAAMWYSGVKNPVCWYVHAAIIAYIAITSDAPTPARAPRIAAAPSALPPAVATAWVLFDAAEAMSVSFHLGCTCLAGRKPPTHRQGRKKVSIVTVVSCNCRQDDTMSVRTGGEDARAPDSTRHTRTSGR